MMKTYKERLTRTLEWERKNLRSGPTTTTLAKTQTEIIMTEGGSAAKEKVGACNTDAQLQHTPRLTYSQRKNAYI